MQRRTQRKALAYFLTQITQVTQQKYASKYATNAGDASDATAKTQENKAVSIAASSALRWMETRLYDATVNPASRSTCNLSSSVPTYQA